MKRMDLSRREMLTAMIGVGATLAGTALGSHLAPLPWSLVGEAQASTSLDDLLAAAPVARYWMSSAPGQGRCLECHGAEDLASGLGHEHDQCYVKCLLCDQECVLAEGERGRCRARVNHQGRLRSLVYGRPITTHVDPIEKKPFYHFLPGSMAFSLATSGCPLRCKFCQNWQISQASPDDYVAAKQEPSQVVQAAVGRKAPVVAFTYNEPTVFTEYLLDIATLARQQGLRSVLISCGLMNEAPLADMCGVLDAIKIDLKGYSEDFYRDVCNARLAPILRSIVQVARSGVHLELVNLVVPTLNDSQKMLSELVRWVVGEVGPDVPVHFTRFHPDYQLTNLAPTPISTLEKARELAMDAGIHYAYVGNVPGHPGDNTYCPACGKAVVQRQGYFLRSMDIENGHCTYCQEPIAGVWS